MWLNSSQVLLYSISLQYANFGKETQVIPCTRVLLEKKRVTLLVKKLPALYGTQTFITAFTRPCHWFIF
jgi:hypothetical protein